MPSCWPPVAWPSLPCSTSCSDPARHIRKATPDVRRSPCRWASFFVPPDCPGDAARVGLAAPLPRSRRTAHGISAIRKKDEKARDSELLRKASHPSGCAGTEARDHGQGAERTRGAGRPHRPCQRLPGTGRIGRAHRTRGQSFPAGRGSVTGHRRTAAPAKTGTQRGRTHLPCLVSGKAGRHDTVQACPPLGRPYHRREERQTGRAPDSGQKKTTGCPGGGAAGQRGRMF